MKKPIRIQRKRTKGWKAPPNTVYVGRPTKWGNPFVVGEKNELGIIMSAEFCVNMYKMFFIFDAEFSIKDVVKELGGKNLSCWCPVNQVCHADILLQIANP